MLELLSKIPVKDEYGWRIEMLRRCVVSMTGKDDKVHSVETDASSLFEAVYIGICEWGRMWWYSGDATIEVRSGDDCWKVKAARVSAWYSEQFKLGVILQSNKNLR